MSATERIFFGVYVLCGPLAWLAVAYLVAIGRERMNKLVRNRDLLPADPPLVSILIPAKDEGERIRDCVNDALKQDYPAFEVIAINDRSTDDTGAILDTFANTPDPLDEETRERRGSAATPPGVRIVHVTDLPPGWLGKCHALDQGAVHARGDWLFFVDSDVRLRPDALARLAAVAVARQYDAISILTTIETHTPIERLMLPLLAGTWMTMFSGDQTNEDSEPDNALANGQVFLIRAEAYKKTGGHAAVKDRIVEDVELMRLLKSQGFKTRFLSGAHLASTRMHTSLPQMFNGWARIFAGTSRGSVWPLLRVMAYLLITIAGLLAAVTTAAITRDPRWASAVAAHVGLILGVCYCVWTWSGNSPAYALLLPVSVPIEIAILGYAVRKALSGKIDWRGSAVDVRQTSRATSLPPSALPSDRK